LLNNQRDQSRTAWSLYLEKQTSVSLLQRHSQCDGLLTLIALLISESILLLVHMQLVSLLQWHLLSMQWSTRSHRSIYQWIGLSTRSRATSESASMTSILNAMIYSLSSFYPPVNLVIRSHATSEPATMTSSKSTSSMSKSISEPASMTLSMRWSIRSHHSTHQWTDPSTRSCATSESATMTLRQCNDLSSHRSTYQWIGLSTRSRATSESASMTLLPCIVSLLQ